MTRGSADTKAVTVLLLEDDVLLARAARRILEASGHSITVVHEAAGLPAAILSHRPALALVDINLGDGTDGIDAIMAVPEAERPPFLFLSGAIDEATLVRAAVTPSRGFLAKPYTPEQLKAAVQVALGSAPRRQRLAPDLDPQGLLSARELDVVEALVEHGRVVRVAKHLHLSEHTVRNHLRHVFEKLHLRSQVELLDRATGAALPDPGQK